MRQLILMMAIAVCGCSSGVVHTEKTYVITVVNQSGETIRVWELVYDGNKSPHVAHERGGQSHIWGSPHIYAPRGCFLDVRLKETESNG